MGDIGIQSGNGGDGRFFGGAGPRLGLAWAIMKARSLVTGSGSARSADSSEAEALRRRLMPLEPPLRRGVSSRAADYRGFGRPTGRMATTTV